MMIRMAVGMLETPELDPEEITSTRSLESVLSSPPPVCSAEGARWGGRQVRRPLDFRGRNLVLFGFETEYHSGLPPASHPPAIPQVALGEEWVAYPFSRESS